MATGDAAAGGTAAGVGPVSARSLQPVVIANTNTVEANNGRNGMYMGMVFIDDGRGRMVGDWRSTHCDLPHDLIHRRYRNAGCVR